MRFRLLDLFCGAGGAAMGYHRAGFEVVGVDIKPQPNYPFEFHQADALTFPMDGFDAVHASPPCQRYSPSSKRNRRGAGPDEHPDLVATVRELLRENGRAYVIENVPGAPLIDPVVLCGSTFKLDVRRHRMFECSFPVPRPPCDHGWQTPRFPTPDGRTGLSCVVPVYGQRNYAGDLELRRKAMGIEWMTNREIVLAIPPAYTEHIGEQLVDYLESVNA